MWLSHTHTTTISSNVRYKWMQHITLPFELVDQQRSSLGPASFMSNGILNFNFIQNRSVVQFDQEGVTDGSFRRFMIFYTEALLLYTVHLGTEGINAWVSGGSVRAER